MELTGVPSSEVEQGILNPYVEGSIPSAPSRVLVFGGRDWNKRKVTYAALDQLDKQYSFSAVIDGMADGADELAFSWALSRGVKTERYKADWDDINRPGALVKYTRYGKPYDALAGPVRNQKMVDEGLPDVAVAFPGGRGTADMASRCEAAGIKVHYVNLK